MKKILQISVVLAMSVVFTAIGFAQTGGATIPTSDLYVISAKAGVVNHVEGAVSVARKDGTSGVLVKNDSLNAGDKVTTAESGRVEVMLNPGSYLRIGGNSVFEMETTDLNDLKLRLHEGSAVAEILASDEFSVVAAFPKASAKFNRSGVFRIDVLGDGTARISVWKGKFFSGEQEVSSGRSVIVGGSDRSVAKFDRDNGDDLDMWSKIRAKELAFANARLQRNSMKSSLLDSYNTGAWNAYRSFGVWVFDRYRGIWTFLPFGYGWGSPYGYGYSFNMWYLDMPYWIYSYPTRTGGGYGGGNGGGSGGGTGGGGGATVVPNPTRAERQDRSVTPPFQRTNPNGGRAEETQSTPFPNGPGRRGAPDFEPRGERNSYPRSNPAQVDTKPATQSPPIIVPSTQKSDQKDN